MAQLTAIQKSCYEYNDEQRNDGWVEMEGSCAENSRISLPPPHTGLQERKSHVMTVIIAVN